MNIIDVYLCGPKILQGDLNITLCAILCSTNKVRVKHEGHVFDLLGMPGNVSQYRAIL